MLIGVGVAGAGLAVTICLALFGGLVGYWRWYRKRPRFDRLSIDYDEDRLIVVLRSKVNEAAAEMIGLRIGRSRAAASWHLRRLGPLSKKNPTLVYLHESRFDPAVAPLPISAGGSVRRTTSVSKLRKKWTKIGGARTTSDKMYVVAFAEMGDGSHPVSRRKKIQVQ